MTDNKRIKECKRKVIAAINEATLPFAVTELILENVLNAVRENMAAEEMAAANQPNQEKTNETGNAICAARGNRHEPGRDKPDRICI